MGTEFTDLYAPQAAIIKTEVPDAETEETPTVSNEAKVINSANTKFWDFFIASGI